jgi:N-acetylmuramoyl-L-alanine amidase
VLDPGHGFDCAAVGQKVGAVGTTNFSASSPPAGFLKEEAVVLEIAQEVKRQMDSASVQVLLTKNRVNECPTFLDRGRFSNTHGAKAFVSIHADAPTIIEHVSDSGSIGFDYTDSFVTQGFAQRLASDVSSRLGLNTEARLRGAASQC